MDNEPKFALVLDKEFHQHFRKTLLARVAAAIQMTEEKQTPPLTQVETERLTKILAEMRELEAIFPTVWQDALVLSIPKRLEALALNMISTDQSKLREYKRPTN